eukprot:10598849-Ditylum_brightwellii.AAC.1
MFDPQDSNEIETLDQLEERPAKRLHIAKGMNDNFLPLTEGTLKAQYQQPGNKPTTITSQS